MSKSIGALARGIFFLEEIIRNSPITLAELHRATNISKATLLRILKTLIEAGWVVRSDEMGGYLLSETMSKKPSHFDLTITLKKIAIPAIHQLSDKCQALIELWVPQGHEMKLLGSTLQQTPDASDTSSTHLPTLTSTVGLAYQSFLATTERAELFQSIKAQEGREARLLEREYRWLQQSMTTTKNRGFAYHKPVSFDNPLRRSNRDVIAFPITQENRIISILSLSSKQFLHGQLDADTPIIMRATTVITDIETALNNVKI
ncbi:helix-turn-helix domain-containing protein [Amphritea sp. 1_MG-2023]|uniref:helix-turn-helix domain-containing protein n=1 Tax=Amphritea sp. 1_MG-2023 TaxID=3062670 RepID=UPI0026E236F6|nr:helix-turn-helix domain-containing protein [Amphritea sp. 1_MG-2023]MDO6564087.1 helix-turn-helix domain-containing protein [Amphritea sp. 1_MG-2023]